MADIAYAPLRTALNAPGEAPKWRRLADGIRDGVLRGVFHPEDRVPPEAELSRALEVSVGTVQKAMRALAEDGLIVRQRRTGTFIADRRSQVDRVYVYRYRDPETGLLQMPFVRTLDIRVETAPGPWRDALAEPELIRVDRLIWVHGDPPAFNSLFLKRDHGAPLLEMAIEDLHGSSCHSVLAEQFNLPTLRMQHRVACRPLSPRAAEFLHVPPGQAGLVWDVKDYSLENRLVLFQRFEMAEGHRPMELLETVEPEHRAG